jgi:hypothetical protein
MQPFTRTLFSTFYRIRYEYSDSRNESEFSEMSRNILRDFSIHTFTLFSRILTLFALASTTTQHGVPDDILLHIR